MLNLSTKEYNLNTLFSFESLKEILLELAKSQIKLDNSIKNIQNENAKRDMKILSLINYIKNSDEDQFDIDIKNAESLDLNLDSINNNEDMILSSNNNQNENNQDIQELEENNINDNNNNNDNIEQNIIKEKSDIINNENDQEKIPLSENKENKNKEQINQENNLPKDNNQIISNTNTNTNLTTNKNLNTKINTKINQVTLKSQKQFQSSSEPIDNNIYNITKSDNKISPSLIKNMMKQIKDQKAHISKLDEKIKNLTTEETKITNLTLENKSNNDSSQNKINELIKKIQDFEQTIETIQSDLKGLDFMKMFQDDGSGSIDATKVLVKALQEKVFKKFELVEQRYKKDALENAKTKSTVDNLVPKIDMMKNELDKINDYNRKRKDEFDEFQKNNDNIRNETKDKIYDDINKNIQNLKEELNNKILNIDEKIDKLNNITNKIIQDSNNKSKEEAKQKEQSKQHELETLKNIENKFSDLNKKINLIDNTIKTHLNSPDINNIKKDISNIKDSLNQKASNDNFKELQNNILKNINDINDMKDNVLNFGDEVIKMREEVRICMQNVESFKGNIISIRKSIPNIGSSNKVIDYSKFTDQNKIKETMGPLLKEVDELTREVYSIRRDMTEGDTMTKNSIKNIITKLDEEYKNLFKELKVFTHKKFLDKNEFNKTIRKLELQLKYLTDEKKKDSESWLLGKRNLQCFNCASCEKNINNENYTTADYLAWKKYPKGEKIHRMGQGFSHMLELMSEDFAKNIEKNDPNINSENNNNIYANTLPSKERANSMRLKRNKKGESSIKNIKVGKNGMKLPKMFRFKKYGIDGNNLSEEDNRIFEDKDDNDNININPRIMKIFKKGIKTEMNSFDNYQVGHNYKDNDNK